MILSYKDLELALKKGQIKFNPDISEDQIGISSIDLRLGYVFTRLKEKIPAVVPDIEALAIVALVSMIASSLLKHEESSSSTYGSAYTKRLHGNDPYSSCRKILASEITADY